MNLINKRRLEGLCVHCGQEADPAQPICPHCGEEPNPDGARLRWALVSTRSGSTATRARSVLKQPANADIARTKEQALLAKRHRKR